MTTDTKKTRAKQLYVKFMIDLGRLGGNIGHTCWLYQSDGDGGGGPCGATALFIYVVGGGRDQAVHRCRPGEYNRDKVGGNRRGPWRTQLLPEPARVPGKHFNIYITHVGCTSLWPALIKHYTHIGCTSPMGTAVDAVPACVATAHKSRGSLVDLLNAAVFVECTDHLLNAAVFVECSRIRCVSFNTCWLY